MLTDWLLRLRALFRGNTVEREMDDELQFHLERQVEAFVAQGMAADEATRRARLELGGVEQIKDDYRDALGVRLVRDTSRDLRIAFRSLRATPIVSTVAVLSLALGIGANTAIFSLVDSLLLRTLPVRDPHRLALVTRAGPNVRTWSYPVWEQLRRSAVFEQWAAWLHTRFNLATRGETQFVDGIWVSGTFFDTLGVDALSGRTFSPADDRPGGGSDGAVCVVSHAFWQRYFAGAADTIGRSLTLDGIRCTVIGVTPPRFFGMEVGRAFDVALPLELNKGMRSPTASFYSIVGRLNPNQTVDSARAELRALQPAIREATLPAKASPRFRETYFTDPFEVVSAAHGKSDLRREYKEPLLALMAVVGLVMLIACANVANLLLARAAARQHEFGVRLALGASRWRLARQVLAESVILAAGGTTLGLLFAVWGSRALVRQLASQSTPQSVAVFLDLSLNWQVLAFTFGAAALTTLLFGLAPALRASRVTIDALRDGRVGEGTRAGVSSTLVVAQLTLSVVLVVAAGLFVRTFASLTTREIGFEPDRVLVVNVQAERAPVKPEERIPTFQRAVEAVRDVPNVASVAASLMTPLGGLALENQIEVSGVPPLPLDQRGALVNHVSPGWFATLGTSLVAGRDFTDADGPAAQTVAIVNEAFARLFFKGRDPIGHTIRGIPPGPPIIVGIVSDAVYKSMREPATPTVYLPLAQCREAAIFNMMSVSIRTSGVPPASLARSVTATLEGVNRDLTWTLRPLEEQIDASITHERITAMVAGFFGALALLLAALGLYGVTAYSVNRRRAEIAIRLTLGASPAQIVGLVASRIALLVCLGAAVGIGISLWLSHLVETLLYGLEPRDPLTLAGAVVVLVVVGMIAGSLPASRAARIQPAGILREI